MLNYFRNIYFEIIYCLVFNSICCSSLRAFIKSALTKTRNGWIVFSKMLISMVLMSGKGEIFRIWGGVGVNSISCFNENMRKIDTLWIIQRKLKLSTDKKIIENGCLGIWFFACRSVNVEEIMQHLSTFCPLIALTDSNLLKCIWCSGVVSVS